MNKKDSYERARKIFALVNAGATFTELAEKYGMSRQHVSEIYNTFGNRKEPARSVVGIQAAKNGLSMEDWRYFSRLGVLRSFNEQRRNAESRGIGWELTVHEWWRIWEESGKWAERGRGRGRYVMARTGDAGPYKAGNVRIATSDENMKEAAAVRRKVSQNLANDGANDLCDDIACGKLAQFERDASQ